VILLLREKREGKRGKRMGGERQGQRGEKERERREEMKGREGISTPQSKNSSDPL